MSRFKAYKGYALFINYKDEERTCRAEIYYNASLLETGRWAATEDEAFLAGQKIIDKWIIDKERESESRKQAKYIQA
jgi:hypothetical protein